jgi:O-antigen ligase
MSDLTAHIAAALTGVIGGIALSRSSQGVWIALCLVVASTTVAREALGSPFETDALTVPLLGTVLLLTHGARFVSRAAYPFLAAVLVYLIANILATWLSQPISGPAVRQCLILCIRAGTFYVVVMAMETAGTARWRMPPVLAGLAVVHAALSYGAYALLPIVDTPPAWFELHGKDSVSLSGLFQEPNLLGAFLATVIVIGLPVVAMEGSPHPLRLRNAIFVITPALVMTYTRSAWLGTLLGSLGFLVLLFRVDRHRFVRGVVLVGLLAAAGGASMALAMFLTRSPAADLPVRSAAWTRVTMIADLTESSVSGRLATWSHAIDHWFERPLIGHSPLSLHIGSNRGWLYGSAVQALHDSGLIGALAMLAFVGGAAHQTWRALVVAGHGEDRAILLGYLLAQGVLFFTSQFSSFFWGAYTWVILGVAVGHARAVIQTDRSGSSSRPGLDSSQNP